MLEKRHQIVWSSSRSASKRGGTGARLRDDPRITFADQDEDDMTDEQAFKGLIDQLNLGYKGDSGSALIEEVRKAVRISRSGDASQGAQ